MNPMERFKVGAKGSVTKTISQEAVASFAELTGDTQPLHLDPSYGGQTRFGKQVAHGVISAGLISAVLGVEMAGPNVTVIFLGMNIRFVAPVFPGDTVTAECVVTRVRDDKPIITLDAKCVNQAGAEVLTGEATIMVDPYPRG